MRHGVTRDERPFAPHPDDGRVRAMAAMGRIAAQAQQGALAGRVRAATEDLVGAWKAEPISRADLRHRFELVQDEVDGALVAADDYIAEAETTAQIRLAEAQRDALLAIRTVFNRELAEMRLLI